MPAKVDAFKEVIFDGSLKGPEMGGQIAALVICAFCVLIPIAVTIEGILR